MKKYTNWNTFVKAAKVEGAVIKLELDTPDIEDVELLEKATKSITRLFCMNKSGVGYYRFTAVVEDHKDGVMSLLFSKFQRLNVEFYRDDFNAKCFIYRYKDENDTVKTIEFPLNVSVMTEQEFTEAVTTKLPPVNAKKTTTSKSANAKKSTNTKKAVGAKKTTNKAVKTENANRAADIV